MAMRVLVILLVTGNISADLQSDHPHFPVDNFVIEDLHQKGNGTFVKHLHSDVVEDDNVAEDLRSAEDELQDLHSDGVEETSGAYDYDDDDDVEESLRTENDGEQDSSLRSRTSTLPDALTDVPVSITSQDHRCLNDAHYVLRFSASGQECGRFIIKKNGRHKFSLTTPTGANLVDRVNRRDPGEHFPRHFPRLTASFQSPSEEWTISGGGSGNFLLWTGSGRYQLQESRGVVVLDSPRPWEPLPGEWTVKAVAEKSCVDKWKYCPRQFCWHPSFKENCKRTCFKCRPAKRLMRKHRKGGQVSLAVDDRGEATVASTQEERNQ